MGLSERQIAAALLLPLWIFETGSARAESVAEGPLHIGSCELAIDPDAEGSSEALGLSACARGSAGAEFTAIAGTPRENYWLSFAKGSLGVFYGPYLSVQTRAHLRDTTFLGEHAINREREAELAVVQIGNPVLHRFFLQAGRLQLPFGIDKTWAPESYRLYENRNFWSSPKYGAALGIDNKINTRLDIAYAEAPRTNTPQSASDDADPRSQRGISATSLRLSYDISALDGSRIVLSGYGENRGVRKMGLGLINVSRRADTTEVEIARRLTETTGTEEPFQQLIRIAYGGAFRGAGRWIVQFDDERFRFRMGTVGEEFRIKNYGLLRVGVVYQKSETGDGKRRWMLTSGLGAQL